MKNDRASFGYFFQLSLVIIHLDVEPLQGFPPDRVGIGVIAVQVVIDFLQLPATGKSFRRTDDHALQPGVFRAGIAELPAFVRA